MPIFPRYLFLLSWLRVLLAVELELEDTGNLIDLSYPDAIDYKDPCKAGNVICPLLCKIICVGFE